MKLSELKEEIAIMIRCGVRHEYIEGSNYIADEILDVLQKHISIQEEGTKPKVGDIVKGYSDTWNEGEYFAWSNDAGLEQLSDETIKLADGRPVLEVEKE